MLGEGIADIYMRPYNFKIWAHPTTQLSHKWLGDANAVPIDIKACLANILRGKRPPAMRVTFKYPKVCRLTDAIAFIIRMLADWRHWSHLERRHQIIA